MSESCIPTGFNNINQNVKTNHLEYLFRSFNLEIVLLIRERGITSRCFPLNWKLALIMDKYFKNKSSHKTT